MECKSLNDCFRGYLKEIEVSQEVKETLEDARLKIKRALTDGIGERTAQEGNRVVPRFMRQGSAGYKTQNMPCFPPAQQVDFDYGCYLPLSYHEDESEPREAANDFFDMVDSILKPLAKANGWTAEKGKKSYCLTLSDEIHFDVPLYSVPDKEFQKIRDMRPVNESAQGSTFAACDEQEERDLDWDDLPTKSIMLAYREDNGLYSWKKSDPRLLNLYFMNKDDDDRAIYRILKGWRDFNFQDGKGPSSIFLMSLAEKANAGKSFTDDISAALLKVLKFIKSMSLPDDDEVSVENPADPREGIKCPTEKFKVLQSLAIGFASAIAGNMDPSDAARSQAVQRHLGKRFPVIKDSVQINRRGALPSVRAG